ncbi:sensor histidine kinase [Serinibacter salmoneus]|uniref:Sensor-like histidine kinase SenX3 n=1 Tax=Serinibacter salmoneus TaxID=556530 RepID=A0A2A9D5Q7_9MICO|nr:HAMP domain-containing sensor histidine kinase [Serinibacter salmoneus]PFG21292.1 phospho-acceptor domain-containing protein [Serinibacter salmoneus]
MTQRSADERRVRRAALEVGVAVGLASLALVAVIGMIAVTLLVTRSRAEGHPDRRDDRGQVVPWSERVIDVDAALPAVLALCGAAVLVLAVVAWFVARRATRPLSEALRVQRDFVADASHELRTPLTTLSSRIQLAQHHLSRQAEESGETEGRLAADLAAMRRDATVMDDVLTDLLVAAETAGVTAPGGVECEVSGAVEDVMALLEPRARECGVHLRAAAPPGLRVAADPTALTRALLALGDNAVRHSPPDATVTFAAQGSGAVVHLRVQDQGSGIDVADPERLFERFVRAEGSARGFGLGLALVRDIAARFGGRVRVESTSASGTVMLLELPAAEPGGDGSRSRV